jgi:uncharacterized cupredoxin-like copper-binding protein
MTGRRVAAAGIVLVVVGVALIAGSAVLASTPGGGRAWAPGWIGGMMGGSSHGSGYGLGPGMMGGDAGSAVEDGPQPGDAGFVAGTTASPRVIRVIAGPGYTFTPSTIPVERGETVRFEVTGVGPLVHEFMVGPAAAVAADEEGTPEIGEIGMMETESLTYTFDGSGPYAFACHADGHYEAGMKGTISVVG